MLPLSAFPHTVLAQALRLIAEITRLMSLAGSSIPGLFALLESGPQID